MATFLTLGEPDVVAGSTGVDPPGEAWVGVESRADGDPRERTESADSWGGRLRGSAAPIDDDEPDDLDDDEEDDQDDEEDDFDDDLDEESEDDEDDELEGNEEDE